MKISKSELSDIPKSSAWYIAAHSEWRMQRRKKRPSAIYPGIRNPYFARDIALSIIQGLILRDKEHADGHEFLVSGKRYRNANDNELRSIIRFMIEDSKTAHIAQCKLVYMAEVPTQAIFNFWTCPLEEFILTVKQEVGGQSKMEALVSQAICSGENTLLFIEAARARGQLFLSNGDPVSIELRSRRQDIISM